MTTNPTPTNLQREKKRTGSSTVESPPAVKTEAEVEGSTPSQPTHPPTETVSDCVYRVCIALLKRL